MNMSHNTTWIAAAILATALAAGCDRNTPDRTAERAGEKMDQAAAEIKEKAGQTGNKIEDAAIT